MGAANRGREGAASGARSSGNGFQGVTAKGQSWAHKIGLAREFGFGRCGEMASSRWREGAASGARLLREWLSRRNGPLGGARTGLNSRVFLNLACGKGVGFGEIGISGARLWALGCEFEEGGVSI